MSEEKDDEILKKLNEQLEEEKKEEAREKELEDEVEKRIKEKEREKRLEPKEAVFEGKDKKKKRVHIPKSYECPECGSENNVNPYGEEEIIFKYRGEILSYVRVCKDCGYRWGETK